MTRIVVITDDFGQDLGINPAYVTYVATNKSGGSTIYFTDGGTSRNYVYSKLPAKEVVKILNSCDWCIESQCTCK